MADAIIESGGSVSLQSLPSQSSGSGGGGSSSSGGTAGGHSMNPIIPLLSADIHVDSTNNSPPPRPPPSSQQQQPLSTSHDDSMIGGDEPEAKRKKLDSAVTSISNEKLELRLGGILCCAVCLDLPKTAMYQVRTTFS